MTVSLPQLNQTLPPQIMNVSAPQPRKHYQPNPPKSTPEQPTFMADIANNSRHADLDITDNLWPTEPHHKKYPKSPYQIRRPQPNLHNKAAVEPFGLVTTSTLIDPLPIRHKHQKGKSMDLEYPNLEQIQDCRNHIPDQTGKGKLNRKDLPVRNRNTVSELRQYPCAFKQKGEPSKQMMKRKTKKQNKKEREIKKSEQEPKKGKPKTVESKKKMNLGYITMRPPETHSISLLSKQYKSLELLSKRIPKDRAPKRQKKQCSETRPTHKLDLFLPSKVNSLYSNTTSLFCSKTELTPFHPGFRIPTQEPAESQQIRVYESQALRSPHLHSQENQMTLPIVTLQRQDDVISTQELISKYAVLWGERGQRKRGGSGSESAIMELVSNEHSKSIMLGEEVVRSTDFPPNAESNPPQQQNQHEQKLNAVIKMIRETAVLGEQSRSQILSKIREVLPIAGIGSQELQRTAKETQEHLNEPIVEFEEEIPSLEKEEQKIGTNTNTLEVYNICHLDKVLLQKQMALEQEWQQLVPKQKGLLSFDDPQLNSHQRQLSAKLAKVKETREQLWHSYQAAKAILSHQDWPKQEGEGGTTLLPTGLEKFNNNVLDELYHNALDNFPLAHSKSQIDLALCNQLGESPFDEEDIIKDHIFLESGEKLEYDYEDDSPELLKCRRLPAEISEEYFESSGDTELAFLHELSSGKKSCDHFLHLSQEQKEDINEYLFIDLCVEIADEIDGEGKIFKQLQRLIALQKSRVKKRKGLNTDPASLIQYLKEFLMFLKNPCRLDLIHRHLDQPLGPTPQQMLSFMHPHPQNEIVETRSILQEEMFLEFDKEFLLKMEIEPYFQEEEKERQRKTFLRTVCHILNRATFDAFNELLDKERPFGTWGQPFPWTPTPSFQHPRTPHQKNIILAKSANQLFEMSQIKCGLMLEKEDSPLLGETNPMVENYLERVRNESLFRLLQGYMEEEEEKLLFLNDQQTELLVELAEQLEQQLLQELAQLLPHLLH